MVTYLEKKIIEKQYTSVPRYGTTASGYTKRSGAPTSIKIKLEGESRWRRLMCWCFSNCSTCFVRVDGKDLVVRDYDLPG